METTAHNRTPAEHTPANTNTPPSGKAARAWPALTAAIRAGDVLGVRVLREFARLYEAAHGDPSAVPSAAGLLVDADEALTCEAVAEWNEDDDREARQLPPGFGIDVLVDYGHTPKQLAGIDRRDVRIQREDVVYWRDGDHLEARISWMEIRDKRGVWRPVNERRRGSRGPAIPDDPMTWCRRVHPSGKIGATRISRPAEERLIALDTLLHLAAELGPERYRALVIAACERSTAQVIGERQGMTWRRASKVGAEVLYDAVTAANDNLRLAESA